MRAGGRLRAGGRTCIQLSDSVASLRSASASAPPDASPWPCRASPPAAASPSPDPNTNPGPSDRSPARSPAHSPAAAARRRLPPRSPSPEPPNPTGFALAPWGALEEPPGTPGILTAAPSAAPPRLPASAWPGNATASCAARLLGGPPILAPTTPRALPGLAPAPQPGLCRAAGCGHSSSERAHAGRHSRSKADRGSPPCRVSDSTLSCRHSTKVQSAYLVSIGRTAQYSQVPEASRQRE